MGATEAQSVLIRSPSPSAQDVVGLSSVGAPITCVHVPCAYAPYADLMRQIMADHSVGGLAQG
jgi:hypothetical protein